MQFPPFHPTHPPTLPCDVDIDDDDDASTAACLPLCYSVQYNGRSFQVRGGIASSSLFLLISSRLSIPSHAERRKKEDRGGWDGDVGRGVGWGGIEKKKKLLTRPAH